MPHPHAAQMGGIQAVVGRGVKSGRDWGTFFLRYFVHLYQLLVRLDSRHPDERRDPCVRALLGMGSRFRGNDGGVLMLLSTAW